MINDYFPRRVESLHSFTSLFSSSDAVDIIVQPPQATDTSASGARITKAVIELKETATLKKSGRSWENYAS